MGGGGYLTKSLKLAFLSSIATSLFLTSCGNNNNSTKTSNKQIRGILIDNVVSGVKYVNDSSIGYTDENGEFVYKSGKVEFYLGNIKIGEISNLPEDKKVFLQDLVGVNREDVKNEQVLKIATLFQSLDNDEATDTIEITQETFNKFDDILDEIENIDVSKILTNKNIDISSSENVQQHLTNTLKSHKIIVDDTAPTVVSSSIKSADTKIAVDSSFKIEFSEDIKKSSISSNSVMLKDSNDEILELNIAIESKTLTIKPKQELNYNSEYKLVIVSSLVEDYASNKLLHEGGNTDIIISFTTESKDIVAPVFTSATNVSVNENQVDVIVVKSTDENSVTYTLSGSDAGLFNINNNGVLKFNTAPDYETNKRIYNIVVNAKDSKGNSSEQNLTINVLDVDETIPLVAQAGAYLTVLEGNEVTLNASASTGEDIVKYEWREGNVVLSNEKTFKKSDFSVGAHTIKLVITNKKDETSEDIIIVTIGVKPTVINKAPKAVAGDDISVVVNTEVVLDASKSTDIDGTIKEYEWFEGDKSLSKEKIYKVTYLTKGTHTITLKVTDDKGASHKDEVKITITEKPVENKAPIVDAGANQTVSEGSSVSLSANASDSDGSIAKYEWSEGSTKLGTSSTLTKSDFSVGTHNITLTVTDDKGATASDTVSVTVNAKVVPNVKPIVDAGANQTVSEGSSVSLSANASDSDGSIAKYEWSEGSTKLGTSSTLTKSDFSVGTHNITLTVTDDKGATASDTVSVTVNAKVVEETDNVAVASGDVFNSLTSENNYLAKVYTANKLATNSNQPAIRVGVRFDGKAGFININAGYEGKEIYIKIFDKNNKLVKTSSSMTATGSGTTVMFGTITIP